MTRDTLEAIAASLLVLLLTALWFGLQVMTEAPR